MRASPEGEAGAQANILLHHHSFPSFPVLFPAQVLLHHPAHLLPSSPFTNSPPLRSHSCPRSSQKFEDPAEGEEALKAKYKALNEEIRDRFRALEEEYR